MKKIIQLGFAFFISQVSFSQSTIIGVNPSTVANAFAIKGEMTSTTQGSASAGVRAINKGTSNLGIGLHASHDGNGFGVLSTVGGTTTSAVAGYFLSSGAAGYALKTSGKIQFAGTSMNEGDGRTLISDASGNANWEDIAIYTPWTTVPAAWRDTTVDGSLLKTNRIYFSCLTSDIVDFGTVTCQMKIPGDNSYFVFPYTSYAGGLANTMSFRIRPGAVELYRFTHDNTASIGASSSLQYRLLIIPGKSTCGTGNILTPTEDNPCKSTVPCENKN